MSFQFSFAWLLGGLALIIAGTLMIRYYKQIADNLMSGVSSYQRLKIVSLIFIAIGFCAATNLIPIVLSLIGHAIFGGISMK